MAVQGFEIQSCTGDPVNSCCAYREPAMAPILRYPGAPRATPRGRRSNNQETEMETRSCDRCRGETEIIISDVVSGEADPLRITLNNLPLLNCVQGHHQFIRPEFGAELLTHLLQEDEPALPAGEEKGLFMKKYLCEECGAELEPKPDHRHTFSIEVPLEGVDPIGIDLTMPVYRCSACGKEQLHSQKEVLKLTPAALAHAFEAAEIPPPPAVL